MEVQKEGFFVSLNQEICLGGGGERERKRSMRGAEVEMILMVGGPVPADLVSVTWPSHPIGAQFTQYPLHTSFHHPTQVPGEKNL